MTPHVMARARIVLLVASGLWIASASRADAQIGSLISPGKLARAHASLEGLSQCQQCHEQGRKVTAEKCLACHEPVARRIAARRGVHRDVTSDCVTCHVEHAGVDGELRPFDVRAFDHTRAAGYPLDGQHAKVAADCQACHKSRSYLSVSTSCATCHTDFHKGSLGKDCAACHTTRAPFSELDARFNHTNAAFPLTGAHKAVECASCHVKKVFKGVRFASCTDCHAERHRQVLGASCSSCHTTDTWRTKKIDHSKASFPLVGRHVSVACASCHTQPAMKVRLRSATCGVCHADVHLGAFKQDCEACHSEDSFADAPFDHSTTAFPLTDKHEPLQCVACHKAAVAARTRTAGAVPPPSSARAVAASASVDFRGLKTDCMSCHRDVHDSTLGQACESCHSMAGFAVPQYVHRRVPGFFAGEHTAVACAECHVSRPKALSSSTAEAAHVTFDDATTTCSTCHTDVHLGQVGTACETCHSIDSAKFAVVGFSHDSTSYTLTGRHQTVACADCHKRETGTFPATQGEAIRLTGVSSECRACHQDVHAGQMTKPCESCHTTAAFTVSRYVHQPTPRVASDFFAGRHATPRCEACHKRVTADFPAGRVTAVQYAVSPGCVSCHTDVHRGSLGPNCLDCHRP